jgi:hypothetical protein
LLDFAEIKGKGKKKPDTEYRHTLNFFFKQNNHNIPHPKTKKKNNKTIDKKFYINFQTVSLHYDINHQITTIVRCPG